MTQPTASLWMGDLEAHMDEDYLVRLFDGLGYRVLSVRLIKDKSTGRPAGYCFLEFEDTRTAHTALMNLNLKAWPNTKKLLKLNWASTNSGNKQEHSVYVGELDNSVNDHKLYKYFAGYFPSCKSAKIVVDEAGKSKGFGFVRFANEEDARNAISKFNLSSELCSKRIRVCKAFPKQSEKSGGFGQSGYGYGGNTQQHWSSQPSHFQYQQMHQAFHHQQQHHQGYHQQADNPYLEDLDPISYENEHTVDEMNLEFITKENEFEDMMDNTRWMVVDNVMSNKAFQCVALKSGVKQNV